MTWHVFNMDNYFSSHGSYREALFEAQCHMDTKRRPRRLHAGFYQLFGEESQRDIATTEAAARQGFAWAVAIRDGKCPDCGKLIALRFPLHNCSCNSEFDARGIDV